MGEPMLTPQELAAFLAVPVATVYRWNSEGTGPRRVRVGKHVRFRRADVDAWIEQQLDQTNKALR
jgi:excisionase family DNA binding protein